MEIEMENIFNEPCGISLENVEGRIELALDIFCNDRIAFFPSKEAVDKAIEELIKLRKEIYG